MPNVSCLQETVTVKNTYFINKIEIVIFYIYHYNNKHKINMYQILYIFGLLLVAILLCIYLVHELNLSNTYIKTSCSVNSTQYTTAKVKSVLDDPYYYSTHYYLDTCHTCSDKLEQNPSKNCDNMIKTDNIGDCCIHLHWYNADCCLWTTYTTTDCDSNGKCTTNTYTTCASYSYYRHAFIKNDIYTVTQNLQVHNNIDIECNKIIQCDDPTSAYECIITTINKNYHVCYYDTTDPDVCNTVSDDSHINIFLILLSIFAIIMILIVCMGIISSSYDSRQEYSRYRYSYTQI